MERKKVDILCVQETRWKGSKARSIGAGFKLFYHVVDSKRNGVGVVLKEEFVRNVLEVKRVSDRVMSLKLEIEGVMLNVVSGYAPQVSCELEEKERFWSELDEVMESIPTGERVVIAADFNGHVGEGNTDDEEVMGKFGVKERNLEGQMVVDFAKRMDMAVVNTYFQKREGHRVTYKSGDLEKAYDRVPREELWYCMRKSGVAEKYVRVVQDMRGAGQCSGVKLEKINNGISLTIRHAKKEDEGFYFCGLSNWEKVTFFNGTLLAVTDLGISVWQRGVSDSVPAGASVTLQCSVLSESRAAELQVLWFRAAPPQSHPQIIYTHHNSSHQCDSGSSTHTCVYNFTKNILSLNDTGTYYCAVALCGKIVFGNGTRIQLDTVQPGRRWVTAQSPTVPKVYQPDKELSVNIGDSASLQCCNFGIEDRDIIWFKQQNGKQPQVIVRFFKTSGEKFYNAFQNSRFEMKKFGNCFNLTISNTTLSDEATYYCALVSTDGTHLKIKGERVNTETSKPALSDNSVVCEPTLHENNTNTNRQDKTVLALGTALGLCAVLIFCLTYFIMRRRKLDKRI
ncbi:hypothetical protein QTP86_007526 [Hemibagrus guttatus]|nr:hypothetical protein QTP86_007526 [Hemibagrus guttatus]